MLPSRLNPGLQDALAELGARRRRFAPTRVRVVLADATEIDGTLIDATDEYVSVGLGGPAFRRVPTSDIRRMMVATPDRVREWTLAAVGILTATSALVGLALVPVVGPFFMAHASDGFTVVAYVAVAGLGVLLSRTGLRRWLTRWHELYSADNV